MISQAEANFLADPTDISSSVVVTNNASDASSTGAEIEFAILATENLTITGGLGYLDAEFDDFTNAQVVSQAVDLSGLGLPGAPEWTASLGAQYDFENGYVRADWVYRDESTADLEGAAASTLGLSGFPYQVDSFNVVNLRAGYSFGDWEVTGYIENATDEDYYTGTQDNFGLAGIRLRPHPRVVGIGLTYRR